MKIEPGTSQFQATILTITLRRPRQLEIFERIETNEYFTFQLQKNKNFSALQNQLYSRQLDHKTQ